MRLLLDSHVVLWSLDQQERIPETARAEITDPENEVFVSVATLWEIAIKRRIGKLDAPDGLRSGLATQGYTELAITGDHAWTAGDLPPHHSDPFDRLLIAQAQLDGLVFVTADRRLAAYGVAILW